MKDSRYRIILYVIVVAILSTIGIQVYWNYKNYLINKQQLVNDVQVSLDKAVDDYYAQLAEKTTFGFAFKGDLKKDAFDDHEELQEIISQIEKARKEHKNLDSLDFKSHQGISIFKSAKADSLLVTYNSPDSINIESEKLLKGYFTTKNFSSTPDSIKLKNIELLTSKIVISISNDSLVLKEIDSLLSSELKRKNINIDYWIAYKDRNNKVRTFNKFEIFKPENDSLAQKKLLKTTSKSTFLPKGSLLEIYFSNETKIILKRILRGILISALLVLVVISSLYYLLKTIKNQKQLAEVKNDLISNITHEFKTPIATIGVALESIKDFNVIDDKEKTKSYLDMSANQLSKLNVMVEKLLETATLDGDSLQLTKEKIDIIELVSTIIQKHNMQTDHKTILFNPKQELVIANVDVFHLENAINNILDNAIKYGGDTITIDVSQTSFAFTVSISDNGNTLTKAHQEKIFEKFYRVSKGNTHDVRGFGIGLYYAKKIAEKHGGIIKLNLSNNQTTFKISIPNE
jgi:two-component system phosphate regulon sensor histidine kinase PhoR